MLESNRDMVVRSAPGKPKSYRDYLWRKLRSVGAPSPKFVVVGTGRSGSATVAQMLSAAGIPCGHESIYTPWGVCVRRDLLGDSSWLAVPSLERYEGYVAHVVRHPVLVAQSLLDIGFFDEARNDAFRQFARRFMPLSGSPVEDAFRWYHDWNSRIEKFAKVRFKIDESADLVRDIARHLSFPLADDKSIAPVAINKKEGTKQRAHHADPAAIADRQLRLGIESMAARYGFDLSSAVEASA